MISRRRAAGSVQSIGGFPVGRLALSRQRELCLMIRRRRAAGEGAVGHGFPVRQFAHSVSHASKHSEPKHGKFRCAELSERSIIAKILLSEAARKRGSVSCFLTGRASVPVAFAICQVRRAFAPTVVFRMR